MGFLFESLVHRDLSVYARACEATVHHYRDDTGLEVDAVVKNRQGEWCGFKIKLVGRQIDAAAKALLKFRDRVDFEMTGPPRTPGVIVGSGYGCLREDGITVVPVAALGP